MVIEGDGFFQVLTPNGAGRLHPRGRLQDRLGGNVVTADGFPLEPPLVVPADATSISVGSDGTVSATTAGTTDPQTIGQMQLARFANPAGLRNLGHSLLGATAASGEPIEGSPGIDGMGSISQGMLEMSNVKVVEEMVNMITAQRAYEANSQAIRIADQMLEIANNTRR
jgi:flagellar basal-body rod protein FlgG